jgi:hypothetical protein
MMERLVSSLCFFKLNSYRYPEEIAAAEAAAAAQGLVVKALKDGKKAGDAACTDDAVKVAVAALLDLKKKCDALKGVGAKPAPAAAGKGGAKGSAAKGGGGKGNKDGQQKESGLGLAVTREEDFGAWYSQVVVAGELIEYYDISGRAFLSVLGGVFVFWSISALILDSRSRHKCGAA